MKRCLPHYRRLCVCREKDSRSRIHPGTLPRLQIIAPIIPTTLLVVAINYPFNYVRRMTNRRQVVSQNRLPFKQSTRELADPFDRLFWSVVCYCRCIVISDLVTLSSLLGIVGQIRILLLISSFLNFQFQIDFLGNVFQLYFCWIFKNVTYIQRYRSFNDLIFRLLMLQNIALVT